MKTLSTLALTGLLFLSAPAWAGDFVDTRLSFVFADDNVFAKAGETTPNSPSARFGAGNQNTQFYDNFNTKFSGFETLSNIVLVQAHASVLRGAHHRGGADAPRAGAALGRRHPAGQLQLHPAQLHPAGLGREGGHLAHRLPGVGRSLPAGLRVPHLLGRQQHLHQPRRSGGRAGREAAAHARQVVRVRGRQDGAGAQRSDPGEGDAVRRHGGRGRGSAGDTAARGRRRLLPEGAHPGAGQPGHPRAGELGGRVRAGRVPRGRPGGHERGLPALPERSGRVPALLRARGVPGRALLLRVAGGQLPGADAGGSGRVRPDGAARRHERWRYRRGPS